ncbi:class II aldolase/adducin family protein [Thalassobaculum sp.]|uniref:class II aldolase/adducin family protein n=1 Tax=Thalassobaculum sp. TaxID=2022740 RepID=UPI0032ECB18C
MTVTSMQTASRRSPEEQQVREDLAAVYRIFAARQMDDLIYTHISARVPGEENHFLINPFGLMYEEVTASNLVKIDLEGNIVEESEYPINYAGFIIHGAVHEGVAGAHCVIHLHTDSGVAVSCQREGLIDASQFAMFLPGGVAYHDYEGLAFNDDEKPRLVADIGDCKALILRNHGTLTVGETVAEAFFHMYNLERACRVQVLAQAGGQAEMLPIPPEIVAHTRAQKSEGARLAGIGTLELAAWKRKLDRMGLGDYST